MFNLLAAIPTSKPGIHDKCDDDTSEAYQRRKRDRMIIEQLEEHLEVHAVSCQPPATVPQARRRWRR